MSFAFNNPLRGWCLEVAKQCPVSTEPFKYIAEVSEESSKLRKRSKSSTKNLVIHYSLESDEKSDSDSDLPTVSSCSDIIGIMDESPDHAQPKKTVKFAHCSSSTSDLEDEVGEGICVGDACFTFGQC